MASSVIEGGIAMREMTLPERLERWADAREKRNTPGGHGSTGTALLREAAKRLRALDQEFLDQLDEDYAEERK